MRFPVAWKIALATAAPVPVVAALFGAGKVQTLA